MIAEAILATGMFHQTSDISWQRDVPEEGSSVIATFNEADHCLTLNLTPAISVAQHHIGRLRAAGVYFEIMAKYSEKIGGEVWQRANVSGCKVEESSSGLLLASYPSIPMTFDRVCSGFQAAMMGGHEE